MTRQRRPMTTPSATSPPSAPSVSKTADDPVDAESMLALWDTAERPSVRRRGQDRRSTEAGNSGMHRHPALRTA